MYQVERGAEARRNVRARKATSTSDTEPESWTTIASPVFTFTALEANSPRGTPIDTVALYANCVGAEPLTLLVVAASGRALFSSDGATITTLPSSPVRKDRRSLTTALLDPAGDLPCTMPSLKPASQFWGNIIPAYVAIY